MTSKRNSHLYTEETGHSIDSSSSSSSTSSYRSRRSSRSSSSREDSIKGADMEEVQQSLKKDDDIPSAKDKDNSLAAIQRANKAHVLSLGTTFLEYPEAPLTGRPINFGIVVPGVYRSSYPQREDYAFIQKLRLKTLVTLVVKDEGDRELTGFVNGNGIKHIIVPMKGTKKEAIPDAIMKDILTHVLDRRNYPLMFHCNHGKHRTGCVVGVMRKLAGWDVGRTVDEYRSFAEPKIREVDVAYISAFEASSLGLLGQQQVRRTVTPAQKRARTRAVYLAFGIWAVLCVTFHFFYASRSTV